MDKTRTYFVSYFYKQKSGKTGYANFEDMQNGCPDYRPPKKKSSEEKEATE